MRSEDAQRLSLPLFDPQGTAEASLGVKVPTLRALRATIRSDLADGAPHGISWWGPTSTSSRARRMLIADHLSACTDSVTHHLVAARLHWFQFLEHRDRENAVFGKNARVDTDGRVTFSPPRTALEWLYMNGRPTHLHSDGLVVALCSALDCFAGTIVGVSALPIELKRADFRTVRTELQKIAAAPQDQRKIRALQADLSSQVELQIGKNQPVDWLDWMRRYRNMLVHRGRPLGVEQVVPASHEVDPVRGVRWKTETHLPLYPELSAVEADLVTERFGPEAVAENSGSVLQRLTRSVTELIDAVSQLLLDVWLERQQHPDTRMQPLSQWKRTRLSPGGGPAMRTEDLASITANPLLRERRRAAALDDEQRHLWDRADMKRWLPKKSTTT